MHLVTTWISYRAVACLLFFCVILVLWCAAGDVTEAPQAAQKAAAGGKGGAVLLSTALAPALAVRSAETWVEWALPGLRPRLYPCWPCAANGRGEGAMGAARSAPLAVPISRAFAGNERRRGGTGVAGASCLRISFR